MDNCYIGSIPQTLRASREHPRLALESQMARAICVRLGSFEAGVGTDQGDQTEDLSN